MSNEQEQTMTELQELMCDSYCKWPVVSNDQDELNKRCDGCQMIKLWNFVNKIPTAITNFVKMTDMDFMAKLIRLNDELTDKSCRSNMAKNGGSCPFGDDGPEDTSECIKCNKVWLLEEASD